MLKKIVKKIYSLFPFAIKFFLKDIYFYCQSSLNNGISIQKIKFIKNFNQVTVLGNGPSLNQDRNNIITLIGKTDFFCVNNFCDDELYIKVKPKTYFFLDAYFFSHNAHSDWVARREKTFKVLNELTTWPMQIIVPSSANLTILKGITNDNISIIKISTQSLFKTKYTKVTGWLFDSGFYGPPQINVLIYAIFAGIIAKYKNIVVFGADLSFHNDVLVDQHSNELYIKYKHFNEQDSFEKLLKNPDKVTPWRMSELLELSADTFYAHEIINSYALSKGIKINNKSSFSLIDAYDRT